MPLEYSTATVTYIYCDGVFTRRRSSRCSLTAAEAQRRYSLRQTVVTAENWAPGTRERAPRSDTRSAMIITRLSGRERQRHREPATQPRNRQRREGFGAGRWSTGRARGSAKLRDTVTIIKNNVFRGCRNRVYSTGAQSIGAQWRNRIAELQSEW